MGRSQVSPGPGEQVVCAACVGERLCQQQPRASVACSWALAMSVTGSLTLGERVRNKCLIRKVWRLQTGGGEETLFRVAGVLFTR